LQNKTIYKYIAGYKIFLKCIAGCTTRTVKIQNFFKMYYRLYNPQCTNFKKRIAGSTTRNVFQKFYTMSCRQGYFGLFIMSKIRILKNYEGVGSRHGSARTILLCIQHQSILFSHY